MKRFFLCFFLFILINIPALACEPSRDPSEFTLEDYVNNAEIVLVGTVINGTGYYDDSTLLNIEVEVESYLKGEGLAVLEISGYGQGPDCLSVVNIGDELIFFVEYATDGSLTAAYLSAHDAVLTASDENIAEVQTITGQLTPPQALSFTQQISRFFLRYWQGLGAATLGVLGLFGIFTFIKREPERKPKAKREEL